MGFIIGWRRPPAYTLNKIGLTPYIYIYGVGPGVYPQVIYSKKCQGWL